MKVGGRAFAQISAFHPELTAFRRDLHAHPELGFEEVYTGARVKEALERCGVDAIYSGIGKTGLVATIQGRVNSGGQMIGLRADMDALPMTELNEFVWKSSHTGLMHGCGHDGHTAMLVGAARYLAASRNFDGTAVLIFQPGEEGHAGAKAMIEDGLFERFPVESVYGMHNWPALRPGTVGLNTGPMMAAADRVTIEIVGRGGHGAHAYQTVDPVLVAAHIITAIQSIVSRNVRAIDSAVISICAMHAGDPGAMSVVPGQATLVGTVRTFNPDVQDMVERRLSELCAAVATGFGATATVHYERIYPATINTPAESDFAANVAESLLGAANVMRDLDPSMGSEDFAFMLQVKPGAYFRIGQGAESGVGSCALHNTRYDFNDDILPLGAALHASLVEQSMPLSVQRPVTSTHKETFMYINKKFAFAALTVALASALPAAAVTLRIGNQGDALSMDPHSLNESLQISVNENVYEPLVMRDRDYKLAPALATRWKQTSPTVWRFELRKGVQFHDGTPFTADDVIFSYERAKSDGSDMKTYVGQVKEVKKVNDHAVDIITTAPFPILPELFTHWNIMSKKWCETNLATKPVDRRKGIENFASFKANGTGPFRLRERQPNVRTVFSRNGSYWGKIDGNVDEVIFNVIGNDSTRVAALLSGEIDVMEPVPVQDVDRLKAMPNLKIMQGPELRIIFLGMDQKRDELQFSNVKGKNPFKDKRVRQAFYQAIDVDGIKRSVMRGASTPTALMIPPEVNGYAPDLAKRLPFDIEASKKLLAEAGYPNGFEVSLNCPNDRYVNDGPICQAVAANLAKVGVKIKLEVETKGTYFPKILRRDTSFYMLGWTASTVDSHNVMFPILSTPGEGGRGQFNLGAYSNARVDELTDKVASETDMKKRNEMIREAMKIHQDEVGHIPLHQQALNWGAKKNITLVQWPDNGMAWKYVTVK